MHLVCTCLLTLWKGPVRIHSSLHGGHSRTLETSCIKRVFKLVFWDWVCKFFMRARCSSLTSAAGDPWIVVWNATLAILIMSFFVISTYNILVFPLICFLCSSHNLSFAPTKSMKSHQICQTFELQWYEFCSLVCNFCLQILNFPLNSVNVDKHLCCAILLEISYHYHHSQDTTT